MGRFRSRRVRRSQVGRSVGIKASTKKRSKHDDSYGTGVNGQHESVKVLEALVAIGAVTAVQVEATRKYVREMFGSE